MQRRDFLRTGVVGGVVGLAGCPGDGGEAPSTETGTPTDGGTPEPPHEIHESAPDDLEQLLAEMDGDGSVGDPYRITNDWELQAMAGEPTAHFELANPIDARGTRQWHEAQLFRLGTLGDFPVHLPDGQLVDLHVGSWTETGVPEDLAVVPEDAYEVSERVVRYEYTARLFENLEERPSPALVFAEFEEGAPRGFTPVGEVNREAPERVQEPFSGSFDGNGHEIRNILVYGTDPNVAIGLFGSVDADRGPSDGDRAGRIENASLVDATVIGRRQVGGLVGSMASGLVRGVETSGTVIGRAVVGGVVGFGPNYEAPDWAGIRDVRCSGTVRGESAVGGAVGHSYGGLEDTHAKAAVRVHAGFATEDTTPSSIGGLVGTLQDGTIVRSSARGDVRGGWSVGGLVGTLRGTVSQSYATGTVRGRYKTGGLVGSGTGFGVVKNSYALAAVRLDERYGPDDVGPSTFGGLVGSTPAGVVESYATGPVEDVSRSGGVTGTANLGTDGRAVYWDRERSGQPDSSGRANRGTGATGLETRQMHGAAASEHMAGFDFQTVWRDVSDDYPDLRENPRET